MSWLPQDAFGRALIEAVAVGVLTGLVGVHVVLRRLSFFTMTMAHATFPGVVAASILGINIYLGGVVAGLLTAAAVAVLARTRGQEATAATGVILSAGFALGVALVATQNGFSRDLSAFLVGSILTVTTENLVVTIALLVLTAAALALGGRHLQYVGFDPAGAGAAGYRVRLLDLALLLLVDLVVVAIVPAVGTILALALIVAPAAAARAWTDRLAPMTALAAMLGAGSAAAGLWLSRLSNVAAGGSISLTAAAVLLMSLAAHRLRDAFRTISRPAP
ncbi:metal ABC transporter permease [Micromonospora eburnea]|uniref:ABC-type Mn2+/Zn2+ transport system, permease component n=1 Tax=Micromonospora eburnea TaxID=227316 RepID=A0A1C6U985_9ACTN|nr:metal ABC transporter permease [Micromonospora eburnea]SCL50461.1 ABC-type Mn2+/Zn2+ transport system, permease component [Micromonospora eburnea]